jgi:hypothetical protein
VASRGLSSNRRGLPIESKAAASRPDEAVAGNRPLALMDGINMTDTAEMKELTEKFRKIGAPDPASWARSEIDEGIPQLARYLFLRQAWRSVISEDNSHWIGNYLRAAESKPDEPFAGVGHALRRLRALGAMDQDITDVVRGMQVELLFQLCYLLEDPGVVEPEVADVQWALVQTDETGNVLGTLTGLHESILGMDPTEREMRPRPDAIGERDEPR